MDTDNLSANSLAADQLTRYAEDFAKVYRSEKEKSKELQTTNRQLEKYADDLNETISELKAVHQELRGSYLETIYRLVLAAEYRDEDTGDHIVRMSRYCALIAEKLGLSPDEVQNILYATPMHDIGKIGIPDKILMKPGKLTDEEFEIMKNHTIIGAKILANSKAKILQVAQQIAISHHERWNGRGYPRGLSGAKIPLAARIASLADVFDALTSRRPYKEPYPVERAFHIIKGERGEHFDPDIVDVFLQNMDEILKIKTEVGSAEDTSLSDFVYSERDRGETEVSFGTCESQE
jgi:putative two-component system response regulator